MAGHLHTYMRGFGRLRESRDGAGGRRCGCGEGRYTHTHTTYKTRTNGLVGGWLVGWLAGWLCAVVCLSVVSVGVTVSVRPIVAGRHARPIEREIDVVLTVESAVDVMSESASK